MLVKKGGETTLAPELLNSNAEVFLCIGTCGNLTNVFSQTFGYYPATLSHFLPVSSLI
jgi:hypothetical protein